MNRRIMTLDLQVSKVFDDIYSNYDFKVTDRKQNFVLEGGSRSTKTWSIIQFFIIYCLYHKNQNKRITISRLKRTWLTATVLIDFIEILNLYNLWDSNNFNKTELYYNLFGNLISFVGLDEDQKLHGRKQNWFWINETIECRYNDFKQLNQRTSEGFIMDYNPSTTEHWIFDHVITRSDTKFLHSTQLDNPFLDKRIRTEILNYEPTEKNIKNGTADEVSWQIYGLGIRAIPQGLIFPNWCIVDEFPSRDSCKKHGFALDYGFTNDPTAVVEIAVAHGEIFVKERIYERGLVNIINPNQSDQASIEGKMLDVGIKKYRDIIIAESAEPKSNKELSLSGFVIKPVRKFPDSVRAGIEILKRYKVNIVVNSLNIIKEKNNYKWKYDRANDKLLNEPIDNFNHAMDAIRYWAITYLFNLNSFRNKRTGSKSKLGVF